MQGLFLLITTNLFFMDNVIRTISAENLARFTILFIRGRFFAGHFQGTRKHY